MTDALFLLWCVGLSCSRIRLRICSKRANRRRRRRRRLRHKARGWGGRRFVLDDTAAPELHLPIASTAGIWLVTRWLTWGPVGCTQSRARLTDPRCWHTTFCVMIPVDKDFFVFCEHRLGFERLPVGVRSGCMHRVPRLLVQIAATRAHTTRSVRSASSSDSPSSRRAFCAPFAQQRMMAADPSDAAHAMDISGTAPELAPATATTAAAHEPGTPCALARARACVRTEKVAALIARGPCVRSSDVGHGP